MRAKLLLLFLTFLCFVPVPDAEGRSDPPDLVEWQAFYRKYFGMDLNLSGIMVPEFEEGFDRILVVAGGLTHQDVIRVIQEHFDLLCVNVYVDNYYDHHILSRREAVQTYAVRVRNTEFSGEYRKMATFVEKVSNPVTVPAINDMTLLERLVYELKYFDETGGHMDVDGFTVCGGSSFAKDSVALSPAVGWKTGAGAYYPPFLFISECYKAFTSDGLYSRHVVTVSGLEPDASNSTEKLPWYRFPFEMDDKR